MTVKGTLKYRKVERTPQVGKDKSCKIAALDTAVTEEGTDSKGDGGTTPGAA